MTNGIKPGAGSDPFGDGEDDEDNGDNKADSESTAEQTDALSEPADTTTSSDTSSSNIPWKFRREGAKDGRDAKQIHLQPTTQQEEKHFRADVEGIIDEDVLKADLREAALLVAMDHPEEVAEQLREWGYDLD